MYRDDDIARTERATVLIDEIGKLEREKLEHVRAEQRLEAARAELRSLQATAATAAPAPTSPGVLAHLLVFAGTAGGAYLAYILLAG